MMRVLPPKAVKFIKEYRKLCKKYSIMIISEGESVELYTYQEDLWGLEKETVRRINEDQSLFDELGKYGEPC